MRYRAANSPTNPSSLEYLAASVFTQNTLRDLKGSQIVEIMGIEAARKVYKHIRSTNRELAFEVDKEVDEEKRREEEERQMLEESEPPPQQCVPGRRHRFRLPFYRSLDGRPPEVVCDFCQVRTRNPDGYEVVRANAPQ